MAFSGNSPLFAELVGIFSNIIQQKRVLDAGQLFPSSHVWNDRPTRMKRRLFPQNLTFDHLYFPKTNSREIPNVPG